MKNIKRKIMKFVAEVFNTGGFYLSEATIDRLLLTNVSKRVFKRKRIKYGHGS